MRVRLDKRIRMVMRHRMMWIIVYTFVYIL